MSSNMYPRAVTGITMGDPSGVGPEIIAKVLLEEDIYRVCRPVIFGDPGVLAEYMDNSCMIKEITSPAEAAGQKGQADVIR
ncbi:MAG: 4-phospho-D-threonate 3-dehydrogenase, partial [Deltaproteobacteria bacterium]|nr:4-phospho-D-threonate 3-dehydrogenase [Deltaproteobacteria bacterium]